MQGKARHNSVLSSELLHFYLDILNHQGQPNIFIWILLCNYSALQKLFKFLFSGLPIALQFDTILLPLAREVTWVS